MYKGSAFSSWLHTTCNCLQIYDFKGLPFYCTDRWSKASQSDNCIYSRWSGILLGIIAILGMNTSCCKAS